MPEMRQLIKLVFNENPKAEPTRLTINKIIKPSTVLSKSLKISLIGADSIFISMKTASAAIIKKAISSIKSIIYQNSRSDK